MLSELCTELKRLDVSEIRQKYPLIRCITARRYCPQLAPIRVLSLGNLRVMMMGVAAGSYLRGTPYNQQALQKYIHACLQPFTSKIFPIPQYKTMVVNWEQIDFSILQQMTAAPKDKRKEIISGEELRGAYMSQSLVNLRVG